MPRNKRLEILVAVVLAMAILVVPRGASAQSKFETLYQFKNPANGNDPWSGLIFDKAGNLYGTTRFGGSLSDCGGGGCGTVYKLTLRANGTWKESVVYSFHGDDGNEPYAGLVLDSAGNLYGTTLGGGSYGGGTVFQLTPSPDGTWAESVLHSFNEADGNAPYAGLIFDTTGNLYGTTDGGGSAGLGTVFQLTPNGDGTWNENVLHSFIGNDKDGYYPFAGLVFDPTGNLYGATQSGGIHQEGAVFELSQNMDGTWTEKVLHSFSGTDGLAPWGTLIVDSLGSLYGTTYFGGAYGAGTIYKLTRDGKGTWKESILHSFGSHVNDGAYPHAGVTLGANGRLYGTTGLGGVHSEGMVFQLTKSANGHWTEQILNPFTGRHGGGPKDALVFDSQGNLYGTAGPGGVYGAVFRITP
jgi:uncharacterized repeat protein (TIGR03803 family)